MTPSIKVKRVYDRPEPEDGFRVLVDRLWPRGLSKQKARVDLWLGDVAPSDDLRKWFAHDPKKWRAFKRRYGQELAGRDVLLYPVVRNVAGGVVTLLFGARETRYNNAVALSEYLARHGRRLQKLNADSPTRPAGRRRAAGVQA